MTFFTIEIPDSFTIRYKPHSFLQMKDGKVISKENESFDPIDCAFSGNEVYDLIHYKLRQLIDKFEE